MIGNMIKVGLALENGIVTVSDGVDSAHFDIYTADDAPALNAIEAMIDRADAGDLTPLLIERSNRVASLIRSRGLVQQMGANYDAVLPLLKWIQSGGQICACGNVGDDVCSPVDDDV